MAVRVLTALIMLSSNMIGIHLLSAAALTTEVYTLSLHDALPISARRKAKPATLRLSRTSGRQRDLAASRHRADAWRSEEHTSELQSRRDLVCRLLLEKKKLISLSVTYCTRFAYPITLPGPSLTCS